MSDEGLGIRTLEYLKEQYALPKAEHRWIAARWAWSCSAIWKMLIGFWCWMRRSPLTHQPPCCVLLATRFLRYWGCAPRPMRWSWPI